MWPEFDSSPVPNVGKFVGSDLALEVFLQVLWFSTLHEPTSPNSNTTKIEDLHEIQLRLKYCISLFIVFFIYIHNRAANIVSFSSKNTL